MRDGLSGELFEGGSYFCDVGAERGKFIERDSYSKTKGIPLQIPLSYLVLRRFYLFSIAEFRCPVKGCLETFTNERGLRVHIRQDHAELAEA